ncbi:hypothetical protein GQ457_12G028830 [Hibiscus cannabinus]
MQRKLWLHAVGGLILPLPKACIALWLLLYFGTRETAIKVDFFYVLLFSLAFPNLSIVLLVMQLIFLFRLHSIYYCQEIILSPPSMESAEVAYLVQSLLNLLASVQPVAFLVEKGCCRLSLIGLVFKFEMISTLRF